MNSKSLSVPLFILCMTALTLHPAPAQAHLIGGSGLLSGLSHPLFGLDHLLTMVAVGVIGTRLGGKMAFVLPLVFVTFMTLGGIAAVSGIDLPFAEAGIAISVLFLGTVIAVDRKIPLGAALATIALFAIFHGHAHGDELPHIAHPAAYFTGFILSTALLHLSGIAIGIYAGKTLKTENALRLAGVGMSIAGIAFLF